MSSLAWRVLTAGLERRRRRWTRVWRWLPTAGLAAAGTATGAVVLADGGRSGVALAAALPLWLLGASWRVWRAPEHQLPDALRFRARVRRVSWRVSALSLEGSALALLCRVEHTAGVPGGTAGWLLVLSPVPLLLDPLLWRLWPAALRRSVRSGKVWEELATANRRRKIGGPVAFDPDRGACGRPVPLRSSEAGTPSAETCRVHPIREVLFRWHSDLPEQKLRNWLTNAAVVWNGRDLLLTDGRRRLVRAGFAPSPSVRLPGERVLAEPPAEMVMLTERLGIPRSSPMESEIMLLDAEGRRLVTLPALGMREYDVAALAAKAGIRFAAYELVRTGPEFPRSLSARMFPRRRPGHIRLRLS